MPNPKRRHTRSRRDKRRANWKISVPEIGACPKCHAPKMQHRVCPECGFYGDELVVVKKEKSTKEDQEKQPGA